MKRKAIVMTFIVPKHWKPHEFGLTVMGCIEDCDRGMADRIEVFLGDQRVEGIAEAMAEQWGVE